MALILNIDTAVQTASVCLSNGRDVVATINSSSERETASWLHVAIQNLFNENNFSLVQLDAVAVSAGPGSYTGLRVGMSAAKGLCYALSKPLITINTLQLMAAAAGSQPTSLLCPMIDARRAEVFTAMFDASLKEIMPSTNLILDEYSFAEWLKEDTISFFGNGSIKAASIINHPQARFISVTHSAENMVALSTEKFEAAQFANLAYAEPFYGKEFYSPISKKNY